MRRGEFEAETIDGHGDSEPVQRQASLPRVRPGDFLLSLASPWRHRFIRLGQALRIRGPERARYAGWTHAALVISADGGLIEAVGSGVRTSHLSIYRKQGPYHIVHIDASDAERERIVEFACRALDNRERYNRQAIVGILLLLLTGCRVAVFIGGGFHCSGLVAHALGQTGLRFSLDPAHIMPADLARFFSAPPPPAVTPPMRPAFARRVPVPVGG